MSDFQTRWRALAREAARDVSSPVVAPPGFASRVVRLAMNRSGALGPAAPDLWFRLGARSLAGALAVLVLMVLLELPHWRSRPVLEPGIENAVAQLVWSL